MISVEEISDLQRLEGGKLELDGVVELLVGGILNLLILHQHEGHRVLVVLMGFQSGESGQKGGVAEDHLAVLGAEIPLDGARLLIDIDDGLAEGVMLLVQKHGRLQEDSHHGCGSEFYILKG